MALVTVKEAAALLGISERAVQKRVTKGTLNGQKVPGIGGDGFVWMVDVGAGSKPARSPDTPPTPRRGGDPAGRPPDPPTVEQTPDTTNEPAKNGSLVPTNTNEPTNKPGSLVSKPRPKRKIDNELWLDFGDLLALYRQQECNNAKLIGYKNDECHLISPPKDKLDDKKGGTKDTAPCLTNEPIDDKNLSSNFDGFDQLFDQESKNCSTNEEAVNLKQTAEYRRLFREISSGSLLTRKDPADGRKTQILFATLQPEIQKLWQQSRLAPVLPSVGEVNPLLALPSGGSTAAVPLHSIYNNVREGEKKHLDLSTRQQLMMALETVPKSQFWPVVDQFCALTGINRTTVYRWWKLYQSEGNAPGALRRKANKNRGVSSLDNLPDEVKWLFWSVLALHPKTNRQEAARLVWQKHNIELSRRQIYELASLKQGETYLKNLELNYPHLARWHGRYFAYQTREGMLPLDVVTADGHRLDVLVIHPETGEPFRPFLCEIYDVATGMTLGWSLGDSENLSTVNMAFIDALLKYGHFNKLKVDCGKSWWQSEERRARIYQMLHVSIVSARGYSPNLKGHEERNFGELERNLGQLLGQAGGYIGYNPVKRTRSSVSKDTKATLTFEEFYTCVETYMNHTMPNRPQSGLGGKSAVEYWQQCEKERGFRIKTFHSDPEAFYKALVIALGEEKGPLTVRRCTVAFCYKKTRYIYYNPSFVRMETEKVNLIFNPNRPDRAYIFQRGAFLFEAEQVVLETVGSFGEETLRRKILASKERKMMLADPRWQQFSLLLLAQERYQNAVFLPQSELAEISDTELSKLLPKLELKPSRSLPEPETEQSLYGAIGDSVMSDLF